MYLVGLTGGIATGKSTVANILQKELNVPVLDADLIAREIVEPGRPAWKQIKETFGDEVFNDDGTLNREQLGNIIFADVDKRKLLNKITHPKIYQEMFWRCLKLMFSGHHYVVLDLPLLFESNYMTKFLSKIIVVSCLPEQQLTWLMNRNGLSSEDAQVRIAAQMPLPEKRRRAQFVIENTESAGETREQVIKIVHELNSSYAHWLIRLSLVTPVLIFISIGYLAYFSW